MTVTSPSAQIGTPTYSLVVPVFNEEAVLPVLLHRLDQLLDTLDGPAEVIIVDDGSTDMTGIVAAGRAKDDPRYRYLALSRNFGHQIAITAGMERAAGAAVVVMDADLQDPPEVVLELAAKWREGYEIVYAKRLSREGESRFKRWTAGLFYRLIRALTAIDIPADVGDFRLVDRKALDAFLAMPERDRFVRGMFSWMGFRQTAVPFHRLSRTLGRTKYGWSKMLRLAFDGIVGFSDIPLRFALWAGTAVSLSALAYGFYIAVRALYDPALVSGWASIVVLVSFLAGMNLLMTGIVGLYVGRIHTEVKKRPLYVVGRAVGFPEDGQTATSRIAA
ncbi:glycosyltransferase family 2 protein [Methylobacterium sp. E-045]|jgi:dolichol-phosphate mannosyltransferase|uniref:glycosyltransferase family 2 protein n=1 Tax=Methylobacterium sp. E-045 TaxID=2836575 RepID=UPI001FB8B2F4|nr:glycosyltransferase family 2 protein [Methylobacterium sp. E-045]MCJ2127267.1 glycosyltransferase family 2 protein [Methylobacterium sp. E-045]